jgi:hypothetical protein
MAIGVIFEFPGATSRAAYEKSVKMILKGRRKKLADWPVKGVLAHIAGPIPGGWRVIDVLAIASGFQPIWQKAQASFERGRDSRGEAENFSTCEIYQVLEIGAREADRLTGAAGPARRSRRCTQTRTGGSWTSASEPQPCIMSTGVGGSSALRYAFKSIAARQAFLAAMPKIRRTAASC